MLSALSLMWYAGVKEMRGRGRGIGRRVKGAVFVVVDG